MKNASDKTVVSCLLFEVGQQIFALELAYIERVEIYQQATALPFTPAYFQGLVNIENQALPQLCLASYFEWPKQKAHNSLYLSYALQSFLVVADQVLQSLELEKEQLKTISHPIAQAEFTFQQRTVLLLNCQALADLLAVKKTNHNLAGDYALRQARHEQNEPNTDYLLVRRHGKNYALCLAELIEVVELKQFKAIHPTPVDNLSYASYKEQLYILSPQKDQQANPVVLIPRWGEGRFALHIEVVAIVSLAASQIIQQTTGQYCIQYQEQWFSLTNSLQQEVDEFQQQLGELFTVLLDEEQRQTNKPELIKLLLFQQGGLDYAIALDEVYKVIATDHQCGVPPNSQFQRVLSINNEVIPIVDSFNGTINSSYSTEYIVVNGAATMFAIAVDGFGDIIQVAADNLIYQHHESNQLISSWLALNDNLKPVVNTANLLSLI